MLSLSVHFLTPLLGNLNEVIPIIQLLITTTHEGWDGGIIRQPTIPPGWAPILYLGENHPLFGMGGDGTPRGGAKSRQLGELSMFQY